MELATAEDVAGMRERAVALTKASDVAILMVGGNEATSREAWVEAHPGDRVSLELMGDQQALEKAVLATGTPTVVMPQNGRPLAIGPILQQAPAVLEAWYLGQETGHAPAHILFGEEVVQLYIRDPVASVTRPAQELKAFGRVPVSAGASARVSFKMPVNALGFYDHDVRYVVEPGVIKVIAGSPSADIRQRCKFEIKSEAPPPVEQAFLSQARVLSWSQGRASSERQ